MLLQHHYRLVGSPIEAPGKDSFGDVDILVLDPLPSSPLNGIIPSRELAAQLATLLGAKHHILEKGNPTMNFAIPWPRCSPSSSPLLQEEKYIQLDLKVCESEKMYNWELFHAAHGDLWNILGSTIRKFGLTVNNLGMYLRIPEIEALDRRKSMIFLTDDHKKILEFIGLEPEKWWKEFDNREDMFEYAAGCRMFWVKDLEEEISEVGENVSEALGSIEGQQGGEKGKKVLKHNDRARMVKRPIFREWIDEFIPKCRAEGRYTRSKGVTREQVRDEAFATFGSKVVEVYKSRLSEWKLARHTDEVWWTAIKGNVSEDVDPQFRAASIRTLKGVVMGGKEFDGMVVPEVARNEEVSHFEYFGTSK